VGPKTWPIHRDIGDAYWKQASPLIERKQTRVETNVSHFVETEETQVHGMRLWCWFHSNGLCFHARYQSSPWAQRKAISRDRWLVVVTIIVWCPLRILYVLIHARNRCVSVHQDSVDPGAQQASPILSYYNRLCFGAHYESSPWDLRNNHSTW
jgi:hypothetical protein